MKIKLLSVLAAAAAIWSCSTVEQDNGPATEQEEVKVEADSQFIPGSAEIRFTPEMTEMIEEMLAAGSMKTKSPSMNEAFESLGIISLERLFPYAGEFEERTRREGLHCWYRVRFDESVPVTKAEDSFKGLDGVEIFEPERAIVSRAVFNDPRFSQQWHYYNVGFSGENYKDHCDINVEPVWRDFTTGDPSVVVGVTDGGIDSKHEDLAAHYKGGYNFVDHSTVVVPGSHGTHVAGTIGAVNNNSIGVSGIAGGDYAKRQKGVSLLSCQIFPADGEEGSGSGAEAIKWAADHGAIISQNSWGFTYETEDEARDATISSGLKSAIDYFIKYAGCDNDGNQLPDSPMKGGIVIFSAGNEEFRYDPICEYEPVLSVGAVAADFNKAYYSNYGDWVDICAPGGDTKKGTEVMSTIPGNKYGFMQGTSMACPHVSGVAALVVSYCGGPGYTSAQLRQQLIGGANGTAVRAGQKIGPLVDALGAITYGSTYAPAKVPSVKATSRSNSIDLSWEVNTDERGVRAYGYKAYASKDKSLLDDIDYSAKSIPGVSIGTVKVEELNAGDPISLTITDLEFETPYFVTVVGYSYNGVYSPVSDIKKVNTLANNPPVIDFADATDFDVRAHETKVFPVRIYDPDGHSVKVKFTPGSDAASFAMVPVSPQEMSAQLTIAGPKSDSGEYTFEIEVTDSYGITTKFTRKYVIAENHAPAKKKEVDNIILSAPGDKVTLNIADYLEDPDGEDLSYSVTTSDKSVAHANPSGNELIITALNYGLVDLTLTGTDARGLKATLPFQLLVKDPSKPVELSSTTVTTELVIRTGELKETNIRISGQTGKVVYDSTSQVGAFQPAVIDVSAFAPGIYKLSVTMGGDTHVLTFIKI